MNSAGTDTPGMETLMKNRTLLKLAVMFTCLGAAQIFGMLGISASRGML